MAAIASALALPQPGQAAPAERLECLLDSESWICREDICSGGILVYQGKPHRLTVDFAKGTVDLNGMPGTVDQSQTPAVVRWRLAILGSHTLLRHEAGDRTFVTLSSVSRSANFACTPVRESPTK